MPLYTEEFQTIRRKMIRSQSLPILCNPNIYKVKKKHLKPSKNDFAMLWYHIQNDYLWDSNAMECWQQSLRGGYWMLW